MALQTVPSVPNPAATTVSLVSYTRTSQLHSSLFDLILLP